MEEADDTEEALFVQRYRAVQARDSRFDGQFVTAVTSTGIYCRPSCPARTPKPENISFYLTSAAAHAAGYRACKRCLPEATAGTPQWNLRHDLAARAMRLITSGVMNDGGVASLSARLGYSDRHIHRTLTEELGVGPTALARAHRAQTARTLLAQSDLRFADVAFAAGFTSVRQFNDTVREVLGASPSEIRRLARRRSTHDDGDPTADSDVGRSRNHQPDVGRSGQRSPVHLCGEDEGSPLLLELDLPVRRPFDAPGVFGFLAQRAITGVEAAHLTDDRLCFARTLVLPRGPAAVKVTAARGPAQQHPAQQLPTQQLPTQQDSAHPWQVSMRCELSSLADVPDAVAGVRRMLDLDADPLTVDMALSADPELAGRIAETPGIRLPGTAQPAEYVTRAIVGQQISVAAARTHLTRLAARLGTPYASSFDGLTTLFPSPDQLLATVPEPEAHAGAAPGSPTGQDGPGQSSPTGQGRTTPDPQRPLRLPARSVRTVRRAAHALSRGDIQVHPGAEPAELHAQLTQLPGIGRWTASYLTLRVLGDPDSWMTGDVVLLAGAERSGMLEPGLSRAVAHSTLEQHARRWSPWRSYAAMHLWNAAVSDTTNRSERRTA